jgi:hypothetical protein
MYLASVREEREFLMPPCPFAGRFKEKDGFLGRIRGLPRDILRTMRVEVLTTRIGGADRRGVRV